MLDKRSVTASGEAPYLNTFDIKMSAIGDACKHKSEVTSACSLSMRICVCVYVWHICSSFQFSSVAQSWPTLCDPMNRSTPGLPVHHQLPEFTQTHVHRVSDTIQPSHPLSFPSPPVPNTSQHQSLFQ